MTVEIIVHAGSDDAFIAWQCGYVKDCRGFALRRRIKRGPNSRTSPNTEGTADRKGFVEEIVASTVGFADGPDVKPGTRMPTTIWPIQKYLWADYAVKAGDAVQYSVAPVTGPMEALVEDKAAASPWSKPVTIGSEGGNGVSCYFNRGIVASQWLNRLLPSDPDPKKDTTAKGTALMTLIGETGNVTRNFLAGPVREKLLVLLAQAQKSGGHVYGALFELDDPELVASLKGLKKKAHILLGNGSVKKKGQDENAKARKALEPVCDMSRRFSAPRALAHNKFLVLCDKAKKPFAVWTGSTNWTKTGLCTQANNALLIQDAKTGQAYLDQWNALKKAGDASPPALKEADDTPRKTRKDLTVWYSPKSEQDDLEQAGAMIRAAKEGILFLMFNPGPRGSLLNDIIDIASPGGSHYNPELYIQGVVNQNPGTAKNPVTLFNRGERIDANADVVLPAAVDEKMKFWVKELLKAPRAHAMVHSKVVILDPYGKTPVVMTGSHNLGPKASGTNDENLVIVQGNGALASQYASKTMEIYNQYRWRASQSTWQGLANDDKWQIGVPGADTTAQAYDKRRLRELKFWFGRG